MSLIIFNCSPRPKTKSTTNFIIDAFASGYRRHSGTNVQVLHLHKKDRWEEYIDIFIKSDKVIFAFPLYVECMPGLLIEFIEHLQPKDDPTHTLAFMIQGGFDEAHQLRTAEYYCEILTTALNCKYNGTLIKGGLFGLADFRSPSLKNKMKNKFEEMGEIYAKDNGFNKDTISIFAIPERYSNMIIFLVNLLKPINKLAWDLVGKKMKIEGRIDAKPYI